jgi:hypothetical protein
MMYSHTAEFEPGPDLRQLMLFFPLLERLAFAIDRLDD